MWFLKRKNTKLNICIHHGVNFCSNCDVWTFPNFTKQQFKKGKRMHIYQMKYIAVLKSRQWTSAAVVGTTCSTHICEATALIHLNQSLLWADSGVLKHLNIKCVEFPELYCGKASNNLQWHLITFKTCNKQQQQQQNASGAPMCLSCTLKACEVKWISNFKTIYNFF